MAVVMAAIGMGIYFKGHEFIDSMRSWQKIEAAGETDAGTKGMAESDPSPGNGELSAAMLIELGNLSESESARLVFNALAGAWNVSPVPEKAGLDHFQGMSLAASERKLHLQKFSGNLGGLLRIDYPAGIELSLPGVAGKRFLALVGVEEEELFIEPAIAGRHSLSFKELEKHWFGQAFFLWKDPLMLLPRIAWGSRGAQVKQLQELLKEAGVFGGAPTGIYDGETVAAVKKFQFSKGIEQDGVVGGQTLMLLYRSIDRFGLPRLQAGRK